MNWRKLLLQKKIKPYFEKVLDNGKLHHAYLFSGPGGVGKRTFAKLLARKLNCLAPETDDEQTCRQCLKILHNNHPDVQVLAPDGAFIKINQIRKVISDANLKPLEGRKKVYIITRADQLKTEAANALLKVLEEPNPNVLFILTSDKPFSLLPTIISRCLMINFTRLSNQEIEEHLINHYHLPASEAAQAALLADGRIGRAVGLLDSDKKNERSDFLNLFLGLLTADSFLNYYKLIGELLAGTKEETGERMRFFTGWLRDLILLQMGVDGLLLNSDQVASLQKIKYRFPREALENLIYRINGFCQLQTVNLNQTLYLENTFRALFLDTRRAI